MTTETCRNGHIRTEENTYLGRGWKECIDCRLARTREWYRRNAVTEKERTRKYLNKRRADDISFRLGHRLRSRLASIMTRGVKAGSAVDDLGCSTDEFRIYIESQFDKGMSWENYGEWHLDHVVPLCNFNLEDRMEFLEAANYLNIRPLWAVENLSRPKRLH